MDAAIATFPSIKRVPRVLKHRTTDRLNEANMRASETPEQLH